MKLYYFGGRGRAELCRLIFAAAVTQSTGSLKAKMPFGQVPALELDDGSFIAQSLSIARYLGVKLHLSGHDQVAHARVDSLLQTIDEMRQPASSAYWNKDKQKMEDWKAKDLPKYLELFSKFCENNSKSKKYLLGDSMTIADISLYRELGELRDNPVQGISINDVLEKYPLITGILANVAANPKIAAYVASRPQSEW